MSKTKAVTKKNSVAHEPFVRMSKRDGLPIWKSFGVRLIGLALALIICAIIIFALTKLNPIKVYAAMFKGTFGTNKRVWVTIRDIVMLLCISVGLAPAFKMRFWNIGAEGQVLVGGIVSAACMIYLGKMIPTLPLLVLMFVVSIIAGGIWGNNPGGVFGTPQTPIAQQPEAEAAVVRNPGRYSRPVFDALIRVMSAPRGEIVPVSLRYRSVKTAGAPPTPGQRFREREAAYVAEQMAATLGQDVTKIEDERRRKAEAEAKADGEAPAANPADAGAAQ